MQKLINSGQKDWKWNLEGPVQTQVLQRSPVLRQCLLLPYVPLRTAGSANGPGVEQALLNSIRKTESPLTLSKLTALSFFDRLCVFLAF